jgi:hypothetical protein
LATGDKIIWIFIICKLVAICVNELIKVFGEGDLGDGEAVAGEAKESDGVGDVCDVCKQDRVEEDGVGRDGFLELGDVGGFAF